LCDILCDGGRSVYDTAMSTERVKCEAAGVLAQITSQQFARSPRVTEVLYTSFIDNMADLVGSLTGDNEVLKVSSCVHFLYIQLVCNVCVCGGFFF
jgi:hypothetical protein